MVCHPLFLLSVVAGVVAANSGSNDRAGLDSNKKVYMEVLAHDVHEIDPRQERMIRKENDVMEESASLQEQKVAEAIRQLPDHGKAGSSTGSLLEGQVSARAGTITLPAGPPGPPGAAGIIGPPGEHGIGGVPGPQGPRGENGTFGEMGPQGFAGRNGTAGPAPAPRQPPQFMVTTPMVGALGAFNIVGIAIVFFILDGQAKKKYSKNHTQMVVQQEQGGGGTGENWAGAAEQWAGAEGEAAGAEGEVAGAEVAAGEG